MGFDLSVPLIVIAMATVLILMMRWVFRPSRPRTGRPQHGANADLGLLTPVLAATSRSNALRAKNLLSAAGIRCSVSRLDIDSYDVLVFNPDHDRATTLLTP